MAVLVAADHDGVAVAMTISRTDMAAGRAGETRRTKPLDAVEGLPPATAAGKDKTAAQNIREDQPVEDRPRVQTSDRKGFGGVGEIEKPIAADGVPTGIGTAASARRGQERGEQACTARKPSQRV